MSTGKQLKRRVVGGRKGKGERGGRRRKGRKKNKMLAKSKAYDHINSDLLSEHLFSV